jgi:hypothetical protein
MRDEFEPADARDEFKPADAMDEFEPAEVRDEFEPADARDGFGPADARDGGLKGLCSEPLSSRYRRSEPLDWPFQAAAPDTFHAASGAPGLPAKKKSGCG